MIVPVVICGGLKAGAASLRHTRIGRPSTRPEGWAHLNRPVRGACGRRETVRYESALVAGRRIGHDRETVMFLSNNPARIEFVGSLRASRAHVSGRARVKFRQEPSRCIRQAFHVRFLSTAPLDRHQRSERAFPNDGKSGARPGNLTARGGKNAC